MSNYSINVTGVKLPTGSKYVRCSIELHDGDIQFAIMLEPSHAEALAKSLHDAAMASKRLIELPGEKFPGLKVSDLS